MVCSDALLERWERGAHLCQAHGPRIDVGQEARLPHDCASRIGRVLQRGLVAQRPQLLAGLWVQLLRLVACACTQPCK